MDLKKKRIAIVCNYMLLPERVGGMDYFYWQFDSACKDNGFEVVWFFPNKSEHDGYHNLTIVSSDGVPLESFFLGQIKETSTPFEIVITHFLELCTFFYRDLKKLMACKVIGVDHNPRPLAGYPIKKKITKRIKGLLYSRYIDLFIGVSNYTLQELIKDFGTQLKAKTQIVYNGISIEDIQIRRDRNTSRPTFMTACHLRYSKGIQDLIDAVYLLPEAIKNEIKIDVYGDGPYRKELESKIKRLNLEYCFTFMGSSSILKSIYCQYDYMLQPTHMECFSLSVLESLAANVPVITTNVGGNEEVVTNNKNGFIIPAQDFLALNNIIRNLWEGNVKIPNYTRGLIENKFTIERMVSNYIDLLK